MLVLRAFVWCVVVGVMASSGVAVALSPDATDAQLIMEAVRDRATPASMTSDLWMKIQDHTGSSRERRVHTKSQKFGDVTKQVAFFVEPANVRNTGLLTWDYDRSTDADDQWLYLPRMRKLQRISASGKSGAFMGSDFSYSDMTSQAVEDFSYRVMKQDVAVAGEACWLLESVPKTPKALEETGYSRSLMWVSKTKLMPLQIKAQLRAGTRVKYIKFGGLRKVGDVWVAHKLRARTKRGKVTQSTTWLSLSNVKVGVDAISADEFTTERLKRGL